MLSPEGRKFSITSWEGDEEPAPKEALPPAAQPKSENPTEGITDKKKPETPQRKFSITSWEGDQEKMRIGSALGKISVEGKKQKQEFKLHPFTGKTAGALTGYLLLKGLFTLPIVTFNWLIKNVPSKIGKITINPVDQKAYFQAYNQLANLLSHKKS